MKENIPTHGAKEKKGLHQYSSGIIPIFDIYLPLRLIKISFILLTVFYLYPISLHNIIQT